MTLARQIKFRNKIPTAGVLRCPVLRTSFRDEAVRNYSRKPSTFLAVTDNYMIEHVDLQNPDSFDEPTSQTDISFTRRRLPRGMVVHEDEGISRSPDYGTKYVARISQRLIDTSFSDFNGRDVALARVQQNDSQNLLIEKLHIGAGSID